MKKIVVFMILFVTASQFFGDDYYSDMDADDVAPVVMVLGLNFERDFQNSFGLKINLNEYVSTRGLVTWSYQSADSNATNLEDNYGQVDLLLEFKTGLVSPYIGIGGLGSVSSAGVFAFGGHAFFGGEFRLLKNFGMCAEYSVHYLKEKFTNNLFFYLNVYFD